MFTILVIILIVILSIYWFTWLRRSLLPAGPMPLPLIGNIHQMGKNPAIQFSKWAMQYGKLYTIYFGSKPAIVISDASLTREIFNRKDCTGRPKTGMYDDIYPSGGGIIYDSGKAWKDHRKFFFRGLAEFERSSSYETNLTHEIGELSKWIETTMTSDGKMYLFKQLNVFTITIIWSLICGSNQDPQIFHLMENWQAGLKQLTSSGAALFDFIGYIAPKWSGKQYFQKCCNSLREFVITKFECEKVNNCESDSLISKYLTLIEGTRDPLSSFYGRKGFEESVDSIIGILLAGTESTAIAINWLIFYLCTHENIQIKVQQEVDGIEGTVGLSHRKLMPYTEAFIEETLRMSSLVPFGLIHEVEEDIDVGGTIINKGVQLIANISHVNNMKDTWGDPEVFRPDRFLKDAAGKSLKEFNMSFQPGRRVCPGESLARDVLFLTVTSMLKSFTFLMDDKITRDQYLEAEWMYMSSPKSLPIVIKKRLTDKATV